MRAMSGPLAEALVAILSQVVPVILAEIEKALNLPPPSK